MDTPLREDKESGKMHGRLRGILGIDAKKGKTFETLRRILGTDRTIQHPKWNPASRLSAFWQYFLAAAVIGVVALASYPLKRIFGMPAALFLSQLNGEFSGTPHRASTYQPEGKELSVASWVYWNERKAGRTVETLPFAEATYYPVSGPRYPLGVLAVQWPAHSPTLEQETLLRTIIDQISACLEREQLHTIAQQSLVHAESERLYATLFSSISHELRTPLASIVGATETLADDASRDAEVRHELLQQIHTSAIELHQFVENLLDMSRLESGLLRPRLDWVDIADLVSTTVSKTNDELSRHHVILAVPDGLPLVKLDHALMEQVLINLLRNAGRYTPEGTTVRISARIDADTLEIIVEDNGPGFPAEALPHLFEKFYRVPGAKLHGSGLGLSIAEGFVEAHGGRIRAEKGLGTAARFVIRIPAATSSQTDLELTDGGNTNSPVRG